ncbi:MAG: polysaccharide biosynthesis C-terminal domain-containing protein [Chitinophagaceae bacterium]
MKAFHFFKSLGYLLLLNVLIKPVWIFGVDRQVQNVVGPEIYGAYFALFSLSLVLSFFADAGLTQMVNRQVAAGERFAGAQLLRVKMLLLAGYTMLVALVAYASGINDWSLLLPVILIQALTSFYVFLRHLVTAHQLFTTDAWLSVIDKLLMLVIFLPLLYTSVATAPVTIYTFLYVQLACTATAITVALLIIYNKGLLKSNTDKTLPIAFKAVLPFALIILLMSAHNRLDAFLLHRLHPDGAYQAGVYAAAYRLLDAGNMIGFLTASFLVPFIAKNLGHKQLLQATVLSSRFVLLLAGGAATAFVVVFAVETKRLLYPALPLQAAPVLQACIAVLPAYLLLHVYGSALTAAAQLKPFIFLLAAAFALNLLLNILLIPKYGALGCCMAALVSQYAAALGCYVLASQRMQLSFGVGSFAVALLIIAAATGLFWAGRQNVLNPFWIFLIGTAGAVLLLLAYIPFLKKQFVSFR